MKGKAVSHLNELGANWSKDPSRRSRQMKALDDALQSNPHKVNQDGTITILDADGETPLHNKATGENFTFADWVKKQSPVDFTEKSAKKEKDTFTPDPSNTNKNLGYSESEIKNFTAQDHKRELDAGNLDKADFIRTKMFEKHESE